MRRVRCVQILGKAKSSPSNRIIKSEPSTLTFEIIKLEPFTLKSLTCDLKYFFKNLRLHKEN